MTYIPTKEELEELGFKENKYGTSPEFIEKYAELIYLLTDAKKEYIPKLFGVAIYEYQKKNQEPLISLLSKI